MYIIKRLCLFPRNNIETHNNLGVYVKTIYSEF